MYWDLLTACAVKETVARLNGIVDLVGARIIVDLPQAKTNNGHLVAAVQLDVRSSHAGVCSCKFWLDASGKREILICD